jgi:hypothetical protein
MPRPKSYVTKNPAIFPERNLALSPAIKIVEYGFWHPLARDGTEVFDANYPGRRDSAGGSCHLQFQSGIL